MGRKNNIIGSLGERIAIEFLTKKGYKVLRTNFRTPLGEIDIIARKGNVTVFVEVKTLKVSSFGPPCLSVTKIKIRHLIKNALIYLKQHRGVDSYWRIDVVSVKLNYDNTLEDIEIIENAVEDYGGWL